MNNQCRWLPVADKAVIQSDRFHSGWWLVVGDWWLVVSGWWLVVSGWWLVERIARWSPSSSRSILGGGLGGSLLALATEVRSEIAGVREDRSR